MKEYKNRSEVPTKYKWDLSDFFKNEEEFDDSYLSTKKIISELPKYKNKLKDPVVMKEFLNKYFESERLLENLYVFAHLKNDEELGNKESIERKDKVEKLAGELSLNTSYFDTELLEFSKSEYDKLFESNLLDDYKVMLERVYRNKGHVLSEREENIITELTLAMDHFDDMSSNILNNEHNYGKVLIDGKNVQITTNNYRHLMKNTNELVRKNVYNKFWKKINEYSKTNSMLLNSYVSANNKTSIIRNFKSSWDEKLFHLNLTDKVYESLVKGTLSGTKVLQKYYNLKKGILKKDVLYDYDTKLELVNSKKEYSIEEANQIIRKSLLVLGEDYIKRFDKIIDNRYIDYCGYKGKCSGGYSFSTMDHDSRILMSFNGSLDSVSTIIHECGHNIHHQYVSNNNLLHYRGVSSLVSEVASLTNECLLSKYLEKNGKTKEEKLMGINNLIDVVVSNLFGAVREGKMEQDFYEYNLNGNVLTKEYLEKLTKDSLKTYYGNSVKLNKYSGLSYVSRSHYYMNFYLYSYAICISIALVVSDGIFNNNKEVIDNYIKFLSLGSNVYPIEAFKTLGIDIESTDVYLNAIKCFDNLLDSFIKIYNS